MTAIDRLRSVDQRWYLFFGGLTGFVLLVMIVLTAGGGAGDRLSTDALATSSSASTSATTLDSGAPDSTLDRSTSTSASSSSSTTVVRPAITVVGLEEYVLDIDEDDPALAARPLPLETDPGEPPPSTIAPPPWAASTGLTLGGHLGTDVGCADDISVDSLDRFFAERVGPVLGWDYQHVYPLGGDRYLWVFQDAFLDHTGTVNRLGSARFIHNAALVQEGSCFQLLHRGTANLPDAFEIGDGTADVKTKWYWPMGGELVDGELWMFWAEMIKDPYDPDAPDGLGWHPQRTFLASYDATTLERTSFFLAPNSGVAPIYGYAVSSDANHTYLFGNTFEQNMIREGGFWNGPHSATEMWLARVPRGQLAVSPQYRTTDGWTSNPADAEPIVSRFFAENPMQPRLLDGQWVSVTAVDGYWGDFLAVDVAPDPWGPWSTVQYSPLLPRGSDPKMNTYHAHPLPWRDGFGSVLITVSNNARNMLRDAWDSPHRYRPMVFYAPYQPTPAPTTTTTTTTPPTTTTDRPRPPRPPPHRRCRRPARPAPPPRRPAPPRPAPRPRRPASTTSTSSTSTTTSLPNGSTTSTTSTSSTSTSTTTGARWLTRHGRAQRVPHRRPDFP